MTYQNYKNNIERVYEIISTAMKTSKSSILDVCIHSGFDSRFIMYKLLNGKNIGRENLFIIAEGTGANKAEMKEIHEILFGDSFHVC